MSISVPDSRNLPIPKNADSIKFILTDVTIEGVTVYSPEELKSIYRDHLNTVVSLRTLYGFAEAITKKYRQDGYFLSIGYIPDQEISDGRVLIKVAEGSVQEVRLSNQQDQNMVIRSYIANLVAKKPIRFADVESFLLRLNDLPGNSYRAILSKGEKKDEIGNTTLILTPQKKKDNLLIGIDNMLTRYLGTEEVFASYTTSLVPLHSLNATVRGNIDFQNMNMGRIGYDIVVAPNTILSLSAARTNAKMGYNLKQYDIKSFANSVSGSLTYQIWRQRQKNLYVKLTTDMLDSSQEILGILLSKDKLRVLRANLTFDNTDSMMSTNNLSFTYSRGMPGWGANKRGDNVSREGSSPDFNKGYLSLKRTQVVNPAWSLYIAGSYQMASGPLYPGEQFSYGGEEYGKPYDGGELSGDRAIAGTIELRFNGIKGIQKATLVPYIFFDAARMSTFSTAGVEPTTSSAQSLGFGLRFTTNNKQYGSVTLAFPLRRKVQTPIYDLPATGPRVMLSFGQAF